MIDGLIVTISSQELRDHLLARAEIHAQKARKYQEEVVHLSAREITEDQNMSGDPVRAFREKREGHHEKAEHFRFIGEHIIPDEQYQLSETELLKVELMRRWL